MIYFDNAATTRALDIVSERVGHMLLDNYGNPSSQSMMGVRAEREIIEARKVMASAITLCRKKYIIHQAVRKATTGRYLARLEGI